MADDFQSLLETNEAERKELMGRLKREKEARMGRVGEGKMVKKRKMREMRKSKLWCFLSC